MAQLTKVLYTAEATVTGGRQGHGRTSDGALEVDLTPPTGMGGEGGSGTNPEQLFALGYAACFQSALLTIARNRQMDLSGNSMTAKVGIGPTGAGGFGLAVSLDLTIQNISKEDAAALMRAAHERCPYSNATRGNITVDLLVNGEPV